MFDYNKIKQEFDIDVETSKEVLDAVQKWASIFNGNEPWIDDQTISLHVAKSICEKVAKAVTIEYKSKCSDENIDKIYQKFLRRIRTNTEYGIAKSYIFFKPYYSNGTIKISVIQADKCIPFKFSNDGDLLGMITVDQVQDGTKVYTRLEYNELIDNSMKIKNVAYEGETNGAVLRRKIDLHQVEKWKDIDESGSIDGIDRLIGGFFTMPNANTLDNSSPLGQSLFHNAIGTLEQIDKQFSRIIWEYEGSELAIDIDESLLEHDKNGNATYPKGKKRLFRHLSFDEVKDKNYNVFSPEIRDNPLFNGLDELLRQAETECQVAFGTISKNTEIAKTATEIRSSKQDYYVTVSDIQTALEYALNDLVYGIYVLCRLYRIPVGSNYSMTHDWDDSILVDKETKRNQALIERNNKLTDDVQYFMDTMDMNEEDAIKYVQNIRDRRKKFEDPVESEEDEE